jgi:aminocarboxymuconate-semialdehyde decarboxylase
MYVIDVHTHIIPEFLPDFSEKFGTKGYIFLHHHEAGRAWMMQGDTKFREIIANCWDPEVRIREMQTHGVNMQVISTIPIMFNYDKDPMQCLETSMFLNDHIAAVVGKYPAWFSGLATVPLQDTDLAIRELERAMKSGLRGVQIGSNVNNQNLNEERFDEFFAACESLRAAVLIHPWQMMGQEHMQKYWLPWLVGMPAEISRAACSMIFGGVFERHKDLKVCFAHGGGSFLPTLSRIVHGWECRPDLVAIDNKLSPREYLGRFWVDSHVCDHKMLQYVLDLVGEDKVMQGSDYPFPLGEAIPGELVKGAPIDEQAKRAILSGSAIKWLGLEG